jgi:predicted Zn-dependent protease
MVSPISSFFCRLEQMRFWNSNLIRAVVLALVFSLTSSPPLSAQRLHPDASGRLVPELGGVRMSAEEQIKLGHRTSAEVYKEMPVLDDSSPVTRYVQHMGARLAAKAPGNRWPFEFHIIAQKEINAFALPGVPFSST